MIPGMGSIGGVELLITLVIILLFFEAKGLPELGKSFGIGIKELRKEAVGPENGNGAQQRSGNKDEKEIAPDADRGERSE